MAQDLKSVSAPNFPCLGESRISSTTASAFIRDGAVDPTFSALPAETGGFVQAILRLPDGKTLVGGTVPSIAGFPTKDVARLNQDGTPDLSFNTGTGSNGLVYRLHLQQDGKILVSGRFSTFNGFQRSSVVRLNQDGSVDSSFNVSVDTSSGIYTLVCGIEPDGKIIICGNFTSVNGIARRQIARLNPSGSLDTSFDYGTTLTTSYIHTVRPLADGKMLVGGINFSGNGILRLNSNGSIDMTFNLGSPFGGVVDIILLPDGKFIGVSLGKILRFNADGSADPTYIYTNNNFQSTVRSATVQPDGKIIVFGDFNLVAINNITRGSPGMARLNYDGSFDESFVTPMTGNSDDVYAASLTPDGKLLIGGSFDRVENARINGLARINPNGSYDGTFLGLMLKRSLVHSQYLDTDGKIFIGGGFSLLNTSPRQFFGRINPTGEVDNTFVPTSSIEGVVTVIVRQTDGKLLVGGSTSTFGNKALWRLNADGSLDSSFNVNFGSTTSVTAAAVLPNGKILIGGRFENINGAERRWLARLNPDGSTDTSFNVTFGIGTGVYSVLLETDGKIIIGGDFSSVNGAPMSGKLVRLNADGSIDSSFTPFANGSFSQIYGIFRLHGRLFVASLYSGNNNGESRFPLVRLNENGTVDLSFNAGTLVGIVRSAAAAADSKIIVSGEFNSFGESGNRKQIARLLENGSLDYTFDAGTLLNPQTVPNGPPPPVLQVTVTNDNRVLMAGDFDTVAGQTRWSLARLKTNACVTRTASDFDGDGKTDVSVFRPKGGIWYRLNSFNNQVRAYQFGLSTDRLAPADFDGDGRADAAVFRPSTGTWYIFNSGNSSYRIERFGIAEDIPYPADFDGDGRADLAVFRPSTGVWYLLRSSQGFAAIQFGQTGDVPVVGDYDGDCQADPAIFRPNGANGAEWWIRRSSDSQVFATQFGASTDKPVAGDYTGDRKTDIAFWQPSSGEWFVLRSEDYSYFSFPFGLSGDTPAPGDYDADGVSDAAVFRPSDRTWYLQKSTAGFTAVQFGLATDKPVPAAFIP